MLDPPINPKYNRENLFWFLIFLFALILRYQYFFDVFTSNGFMASNTDAYYRLHRIVAIVNQPGWFNFTYPLFDVDLHFPQGLNVAWPLGLDLFFVIPLKLFGVHDVTEITFLSFIFIPLLIVPMIYFVGKIAKNQSNSRSALLAGLLIAITPAILVETMIGNVDHHAIGSLLIVLVFYLMEKAKKNESIKYFVYLGLLLGFAPSIDPHGWFACLMIGSAMISEKNSRHLFYTAISLSIGCILSSVMLLFSDRFRQGYVSVAGFSWWAPGVMAMTAAFVFLLYWIRKEKKPIHRKTQLVLILIIVIGVIIIAEKYLGSFGSEFQNGINWLFLKKGTIGQTSESLSLFDFPIRIWNELWLLFFVLLIEIYFLWRKKHLTIIFYSIIPIVLSFVQVRFFVNAAPWLVLLFVFFLEELGTLIRNKVKRGLVYIFCVLTVFFCFYPPPLSFKINTTNLVHQYFWAIRDASKFLRVYHRQGPVNDPSAIIAPWDEGNWILFFSELPVVADPFQGESALRTNELFLSREDNALDEFYKTMPARFLMVEQSIPRTYELLAFTGKNPRDYFNVDDSETIKKIDALPAYEDILSRKYYASLGVDKNGDFPDHWRLVYVSGYSAADIPNLPALKVFEHVSGVRIHMTSVQKDLYLKGAVSDRTNLFLLQKKAKILSDGSLEWTLPYAIQNQGGVFCDGNFVIVDRHNKIIKHLPKIDDQQVVNGETILLR